MQLRLLPHALFIGLAMLVSSPVSAAPGDQPQQFASEEKAQEHCPHDVIVWLNIPTGVYHFRGQRWYANTKSGAFVCKAEADQAGDRATRNGQ